MFLRPYKTVVFNHLAKILADISTHHKGKFAVDAASAGMKNKDLFRDLKYIGVDIDQKALEEGLKMHPTAIGVYADLTKIHFKPNTAIVTVSTHTLEAIRDPEARKVFLRELIGATASDGKMVLLINLCDDVEPTEVFKIVENSFDTVKRSYYRLPLTSWFEDKWFIPLKLQVSSNILLKIVAFVFLTPVIYFLILLEKMLSNIDLNQAVVLLECQGKRNGKNYENGFEIFNCEKKTENFWVMSGI